MKNCFVPSAVALLAFAGLAQAQTELFNNGTNATAGAVGTAPIAGAALSVIDANSNIFGISANSGANVLVGDDFTVPCGRSWTVNSIKVYTYQTGATTPTITGAVLQIWDGLPGAPGSTVVFGDTTTNLITDTATQVAWASPAIYRVQAGVTNNTQRRIQEVTINLPTPIVLDASGGTRQFWFTYGLSSTLSASGPWGPPLGVAPGPSFNAVQSTDGGLTFPQVDQNANAAGVQPMDVSFKVVGTRSGAVCPPPATQTLAIPGNGSFATATTPIAAGNVKFFSITIPAIGAGSRLDITTEGSNLSAPTFGPGLLNDTILALYGPEGELIGSDDDDGSGFMSQLSFGTPIGFSTNTGLNFDGRDGATLAAGTYVIGVCGIGNPTNILPAFGLTTNSDATGSITVNARVLTGLPALSGNNLPGLQTLPALSAGSTVNASVPVAAGVTKWVKFTLPAAIALTEALDIFTEGSTLAPENDVSLGLYNSTGALVATDFINGSGSLALMSFGGGFRSRIGTSWNFTGQNGGALAAGDYYLAVIGDDTSQFGASNFSAVNGGALNAGNVNLSVRYRTDVTGDIAATPTVAPEADFGELTGGTATRTVTVDAETVTYFRFEIPATASLTGQLIIDTEGTSLTPDNDTAIRIFDANGASPATLGGADFDDGSSFLSQMCFGNGLFVFNTPALAQRGNSRDGAFPGAGVYYVGVRTGNAGGSGVNNWNLNANGLNAGSMSLRIRYVPEVFDITASEAPTPSYDLAAIGGTITNTLVVNPADVVWTKFVWPATATFADWIDIDTVGTTAATDTIIAVYDTDGNRLIEDDDGGPALLSQVTFGGAGGEMGRDNFAGALPRNGASGVLTPGSTYWIGATIWAAAPTFGAGNWDVSNPHADIEDTYTINIRTSLPPLAPACLADVVADGSIDGSDFIAFINSFAIGDASVDPVADIVDAGGTAPGDGTIDGSDFIAFINAFGAGC